MLQIDVNHGECMPILSFASSQSSIGLHKTRARARQSKYTKLCTQNSFNAHSFLFIHFNSFFSLADAKNCERERKRKRKKNTLKILNQPAYDEHFCHASMNIQRWPTTKN